MICPKLDKDFYEKSGAYICTCDLEQNEKKAIDTVNGEVTLHTPQKYNNNHRTAHPTIGTIVATFGNTEFEVGQDIFCKHFTFETEEKEPKVFFEEEGIQYFCVYNGDVTFGIEGEELQPREGIVLCEPIEDKLIDTFLELQGGLVDYRRDLVKVIKSWSWDSDYEKGDYLLLEKGGDYHFSFKGKDYVRCNDYFDDIVAVVDNPKWRVDELMIHKKDHSTVTDKNT